MENTADNTDNWADQPAPNFEQQADESGQETWNPDDMDENQMTGIQKFMNISIVAHEDVAKEIKHQVREGHINPIQAFVALKRVDKIAKLCLDSQEGDKELRETILESVRKSLDGGKSLDIYGANLRIQATGTFYDYSECGDTLLNSMYAIQKEINEKVKARELEIKTMLPPDNNKLGIQSKKVVHESLPKLVWEEDEVIETIFPCIKKAGESVICTFKKNKE